MILLVAVTAVIQSWYIELISAIVGVVIRSLRVARGSGRSVFIRSSGNMIALDCQVQKYDWGKKGSTSAVAKLKRYHF